MQWRTEYLEQYARDVGSKNHHLAGGPRAGAAIRNCLRTAQNSVVKGYIYVEANWDRNLYNYLNSGNSGATGRQYPLTSKTL